jgi:hypothetical protein
MIIYLDMDDVVADWRTAAEDFLKKKFNNGEGVTRLPIDEWNKLKANSRFYRDLPLKPGANELVNFCRQAVLDGTASDLRFLSALPRNNDMHWATWDKTQWAQLYFPGIPVFLGPYSDDKWKHCQPGDILIDDRTDNCMQWQAHGGYAHIYRTWEQCKPWLEQQFEGVKQSTAWLKNEYYEEDDN